MLAAMNHDQAAPQAAPHEDPARRRAARVRLIRRRVVGGGVGLFAAVWLLITATLVSGKDPGLTATKTTARVATTTTATSTSTAATRTRTSGSASQAGSATAAQSSKASTASPSPVTTQQS
jgi:hypothetical protein